MFLVRRDVGVRAVKLKLQIPISRLRQCYSVSDGMLLVVQYQMFGD